MPLKRWIKRDKEEQPAEQEEEADDAASTFSFDLDRQTSVKFYKPVETPAPPPEYIEYDSEFDSDLNVWDDEDDGEDLDHLYGSSSNSAPSYFPLHALPPAQPTALNRPKAPQALLLRAQSARERVVERPEIARQSSLVIRKEDSIVTYFNVSPVLSSRTDSARSRSLESPLESIRED